MERTMKRIYNALAPWIHHGGGGFNRFAHSAGPICMVAWSFGGLVVWLFPSWKGCGRAEDGRRFFNPVALPRRSATAPEQLGCQVNCWMGGLSGGPFPAQNYSHPTPKIAYLGIPKLQILNGFGGRFGLQSGPPLTQPIHPPINLTAQLLKRGGGSARQGNWIEKSMAVFYASASLPRRNKLNDQINKKRPHKRTTKKPHNATRGPAECALRLNMM